MGSRPLEAEPGRRPGRLHASRDQPPPVGGRRSGSDRRSTGATPGSEAPVHADPGDVTVEPLQLYTPASAAQLLVVRESWLRCKAASRLVPCTYLGKHLRFSYADLIAIIAAGAQPASSRRARSRSHPRRD